MQARHITKSEAIDKVRRMALDLTFERLFPVHVFTEDEVRDVMFERQMEMTVYGMHLIDLKWAVRVSPKSPPMYAEEILCDAQNAFACDLFATGQLFVNQARWVLANVEVLS